MKLSEFKGEEAVDVLAALMVPAISIATDEKLQEAYKTKSVGEVFSYMMKNYKKEVLEIYAVLYRDKGENATPTALLQLCIEIMQDEELRGLFFSSQSQNERVKSSGEVTENTKAKEK